MLLNISNQTETNAPDQQNGHPLTYHSQSHFALSASVKIRTRKQNKNPILRELLNDELRIWIIDLHCDWSLSLLCFRINSSKCPCRTILHHGCMSSKS